MNTITISSSDLGKAIRLAIATGFIIDRIYGGMRETMQIGARKAGPRGNHEPRWTDAEARRFVIALGA